MRETEKKLPERLAKRKVLLTFAPRFDGKSFGLETEALLIEGLRGKKKKFFESIAE